MKKTKMTSPQSRRKQLWLKAISMMLSLAILFCFTPVVIYAEIAESLKAEDAEAATAVEEEALSTDDLLVYEDTSLRETNVKHFRLADGTYVAAQYAYPVHYTNADGELEDIDNNLSESSGGIYANSTARIKFAKKTNGSSTLFTLKDGNTKLEMSLINARKGIYGLVENSEDNESDTELQKMMHLENLSSKITYHNILDGVDLEYVIHSLNVKENIIVRKQSDSYSYEFELKLNGLTAALTESQDIEIRENGALKYVIPAPVVFDAVGQHADSDDAYYTLSGGSNGKYLLTVTVDPEWMNADERSFPVTVDPSVGASTNLVVDTYIDPSETSSNISKTALRLDEDGIVYWRVSALPSIPSDAYVSECTISYYATEVNGSMTVSAHEVTSSFLSGITYNDYVGGAGALDTAMQDIQLITSPNTTYTWNITDAYNASRSGTGINFAIALRFAAGFESASNSYVRFSSREGTVKPELSVTYRNIRGVENYYAYSSSSAGLAGSGSINLATGDLTFAIPTLSTTDYLMPFTPTLIYNSGIANVEYTAEQDSGSVYSTAITPIGFMLNVMESVKPVTMIGTNGAEVEYMLYTDSDGSHHYFEISGVGDISASDEDGLGLIMSFTRDDAKNITSPITITSKSRTTHTFTKTDSKFILTSIEDVTGSAIVFATDHLLRVTTVSLDPAGSAESTVMLEFYYNSDGRLSWIYKPPTREAAVFRYSNTYNGSIVANGGKYLRQIDYAHGSTSVTASNWYSFSLPAATKSNITLDASAYYEYDANGHLLRAVDGLANQAILYGFSDSKISSVQEMTYPAQVLGQIVEISYGIGYADVRATGNDDVISGDDIITRYIFDSSGRSVSAYSFAKNGSKIYGAVYG